PWAPTRATRCSRCALPTWRRISTPSSRASPTAGAMPMSMRPLPERHRADRVVCLRTNDWCAHAGVLRLFAATSRLGDGLVWYVLVAAMGLFDGAEGLRASAHMAATGAIARLLYKGLKRWTRRPRPFAADVRIRAWIAPLDEFSFPSGHTLHAVAFTI